jgi:GAF domain-containing protein
MAALGTVVCDEARRIFDCEEAHVYMSNLPAADPTAAPLTLDLVAVRGAPRDRQGRPLPLPADGVPANAVWRALTSGSPFVVPQVADAGPARPGTWSMLVVPMRADDWVNGVICLLARSPRRFSDDDLRLVQVLSDQAAVAVENARLLRAREELVEELAALLDISQATTGGTDELTLASCLAAKMRAPAGWTPRHLALGGELDRSTGLPTTASSDPTSPTSRHVDRVADPPSADRPPRLRRRRRGEA